MGAGAAAAETAVSGPSRAERLAVGAGAGWAGSGSAFGWLVTASVSGVEALAAGAAASGGKGESDEGVWVAVGPPRLLLWWLPAVEACGVRSVVLLLLLQA